jgi:uncharacterized protein
MEATDSHTYYTQRLCHEIFTGEPKVVKHELVMATLNGILKENEGVYFQYRNLLTQAQWNLLKAIAIEEKVQQPYAQKFIYTHRLGTPANVKRGLESLLEKEMVYFNAVHEIPFYEVYDKFLMHWLKRK